MTATYSFLSLNEFFSSFKSKDSVDSIFKSLPLSENNDLLLGGVVLTTPAIIIAISLLLCCFIIVSKRHKAKKQFPPVFPLKKLIKVVKALKKTDQKRNPPKLFLQVARQMGKYTYALPKVPFLDRLIIVGDAKLAREILMDSSTSKPRDIYGKIEPRNVGCIFTRNGKFWQDRRKGVTPAFSKIHIQRMNQVALDCTDKWITNKLIPLCENDKTFDVAKEMANIILEAICKTGFEYEITEQEMKDFLINDEIWVKEFINKPGIRQYIPLWFIPSRREAFEADKKMLDFFKKIMNTYRCNPNPAKGTIIDLVLNNPCYKNDDERAYDVFIYLFAGYDTTAYSIAWTLLELARHPHEQDKVREAIKQTSATVATSSRCEVLQRAIKESMRLNPVSGIGSMRLCGRDFIYETEGFIIPKGSIVNTSIMCMHRNEYVYGETVDQYIPSRWENATKAQKDHFMIFSSGKQNCVGQVLGSAETYCILHRILSQFKVSVDDNDVGSEEFFLTLKPDKAMLKAERIDIS